MLADVEHDGRLQRIGEFETPPEARGDNTAARQVENGKLGEFFGAAASQQRDVAGGLGREKVSVRLKIARSKDTHHTHQKKKKGKARSRRSAKYFGYGVNLTDAKSWKGDASLFKKKK